MTAMITSIHMDTAVTTVLEVVLEIIDRNLYLGLAPYRAIAWMNKNSSMR